MVYQLSSFFKAWVILAPKVTELKSFLFKNPCSILLLFLVALLQGKGNLALTPEEYRAPAITFLIHHVQTY